MRSPATVPPPRVRPARASDADALLTLLGELERTHARLWPGFFRDGGVRATGLRAAHVDPNESIHVAEEARRIVGLVRARVYDAPAVPALVPARRLHVEDLVVAADVRGRGVGRRLLRAAERWGRGRGCTQSVLTVWSGNDEALGFYRALDYRDLHRVLVREI